MSALRFGKIIKLTKSRFLDSLDTSSKPDRSQYQEQPRTNDENPNGPRDDFASWCKALGSNGCGHDRAIARRSMTPTTKRIVVKLAQLRPQ